MESMVVEDTLEVVKSILGEGHLTRIQEEFAILVSIKLEVPGPFERMTMWLAACTKMHSRLCSDS